MIVHEFKQRSEEWENFKIGKIGGTRVQKVCGTDKVRDTILNEILSEDLTGIFEYIRSTPAMEWGKDHEDEAADAFQHVTDIPLDEVGCIQSSQFDMLMHSPDRVCYNKKGVLNGGVEIKCPLSKTHLKYIRSKKVPSEYIHQCLLPFIISEDIEFWFFMSYDPRVSVKPIHILPIDRSDYINEIKEMKDKIESFVEMYNVEKSKIYLNK